MNIDELTIGQAHEVAQLFTVPGHQASHSFRVGTCYLIRTVTMMYTGMLSAVTDTDLILADAAWIADSGRYADALEKGTLNEVEPYPGEVIVSRAAIVDAAEWTHPLPREQK